MQIITTHKDIFDIFSPDEIELDDMTRLIIVDTNRWNRLDQMERLAKKKNKK